MSFSHDTRYQTRESAVASIDADKSLPDTIKEYLKEGVNNLAKNVTHVHVKAYGHLHDGTSGNYPITNATIEVAQANVLDPAFTNLQTPEEAAVEEELDETKPA